MKHTFVVSIGGAAGQGVATPGNILARIFARRGLYVFAYNAYQSIIRGGHTFLTIRTGPEKVTSFGDKIDLPIPLNQDTMDRHLGLPGPGATVVYNGDSIKPGTVPPGVRLCPLPVSELSHNSRNKVEQNTLAVAAALNMVGIGFQPLEDVLTQQFKKKGDAVVAENIEVARTAYLYTTAHFEPFPRPLPMGDHPKAMLTGNMALAMGGAAAGVRFYCAYPMSPATGVLHWMAVHARNLAALYRGTPMDSHCDPMMKAAAPHTWGGPWC